MAAMTQQQSASSEVGEVQLLSTTASSDGGEVQLQTSMASSEGGEVRRMSTARARLSLALTEEQRRNKHMVRGVNAPNMLWRGGRPLQKVNKEVTQEEAQRQYEKSVPIPRYHEFVSHTWWDSALSKYICLILYFNGVPACIMSVVAAFVAFCLRLFGYLPAWATNLELASGTTDRASWSVAAGMVVFTVCLLGWHHLPAWLGGGLARSIFFDKLCVHQTDPYLKEQAIKSFAAYINISERVVILWSPKYFKRLWCTLELAALSLREVNPEETGHVSSNSLASSLVFRPLVLGVLVLVGNYVVQWSLLGIGFGYILSVKVGFPASTVALVPPVVVGCISMILFHYARGYARGREELAKQLQTFAIEDAGCFSQEDRAQVLDTVGTWFADIAEFNAFIRNVVSERVLAVIPGLGDFPLRNSAIMILPMLWNTFDNLPMFNLLDRDVILDRLFMEPSLVLVTLQYPAVLFRLASVPWVRRRRPGCLDALFSPLAGIPAALEFGLLYVLRTVVVKRSRTVQAIYMALLIAVNVFLYYRPKCRARANPSSGAQGARGSRKSEDDISQLPPRAEKEDVNV